LDPQIIETGVPPPIEQHTPNFINEVMTMGKPKIKYYESDMPGLVLSTTRFSENIIFVASAPGPNRKGYYQTDDPEKQKFVEEHKTFQQGIVRRKKTPEELEQEAKAKKQAERLEFWKEVYRMYKNLPDFGKMKAEEVKALADDIGAEVADADTKAVMADKIALLITGEKPEKE